MKSKKTGKISYTIYNIPGDLLESFRECSQKKLQTMRISLLKLMDQFVLETRTTHRTSIVMPPPVVEIESNFNPFGDSLGDDPFTETDMTPEEIADVEAQLAEQEKSSIEPPEPEPKPIEGDIL